MRTFTAILIPESIRTKIYVAGQNIPGIISIVPQANIHITLNFLGELDGEQLKLAAHLLDSLSMPKFEIELNGISCFGKKKADVIYAKISDNTKIIELYENLKSLFKSNKIITDKITADKITSIDNSFKPHATFARAKEEMPGTRDFIEDNKETYFGLFEAKSIFLLRSDLSSNSPIYSVLYERKLS